MSNKEESSKVSSDPTASWPQVAAWYVRNDESRVPKRNKSAFPCPRWGHASTDLDGNVYVFGGSGEKTSPHYWESPYRLDPETLEWIKLEANNKPSGLRDSHSMNIYREKLYIFGGSLDGESRNDLCEFDLNTNMWRIVDAKGAIPPAREGHSSCLYEDRYLVVYGGWNGKITLNDCYLFDIPNSTWIKVEKKSGTEPLARESQSCCLAGDYMYIFGGQGNDIATNEDIFLNDLYRLKITVENNKAFAVWEKLEPEGPVPPQRSSHASCVYRDKYMFIIGGEGYNSASEGKKSSKSKEPKGEDAESEFECFPKNDIWYYNIEINRWFNLKVKNEAEFSPRFAHTCNTYRDSIIIFGGLRDSKDTTSDICILSMDGTNPFTNVKAAGTAKPKREQKSISQEPDKTVLKQQQKEQQKEEKKEQPKEIPQTQPAVTQPKANKPAKPTVETANIVAPSQAVGTPMNIESAPVKDSAVPMQVELDGPFVSTSFLHSLSSLVGWPLAAFGLLVDNSVINKAGNMRIDVMTRKKKNPEGMQFEKSSPSEGEITYLVVEDDGKGWKHNEFVNIFMRFDTDNPEDTSLVVEETEANPQEDERKKKINEYSFNLKSGAFRLGKTLIYITKFENEVSIGFITVNKRFNPDVHDNHVFLYSWKKGDTFEFLTSQAQKNKDIIMNILLGLFTEEDLLQNMDKISNRLLILDLNPVAMSKSTANTKSQDFELILFKKNERTNDILVRTLDESLKPFYSDPQNALVELSLRTYLSHLFLDPSQAGLEIWINDQQVQFMNVKQEIENKNSQPSYQHIEQEGLFNGFFFDTEVPKDDAAGGENKDNSKWRVQDVKNSYLNR